jgi:protein-arginine kinase activator protein McsA
VINSSYNSSPKGYENLSITQLQLLLTKALESEDFETASLIQEEIKKR